MSKAMTTVIPNRQIKIRKGDFKASLNPFMPSLIIRKMLNTIPARQSNITAMARIIIIGVKRNLNFLASWGADCFFI